jgi:hypothetical protein
MHDVVGDRAQQHADDPAPTMCRHDDHVGMVGLRTLDEDGGSVHPAHRDVGAEAVRPGRSAKKGAEAPFCRSAEYV